MSHTCLYSPASERHCSFWLVLISHLAKCTRLSWLRWVVKYYDGLPSRRRSPIPFQPPRSGIELTTIESQVQCSNHYTTEPPKQWPRTTRRCVTCGVINRHLASTCRGQSVYQICISKLRPFQRLEWRPRICKLRQQRWLDVTQVRYIAQTFLLQRSMLGLTMSFLYCFRHMASYCSKVPNFPSPCVFGALLMVIYWNFTSIFGVRKRPRLTYRRQ